MPLPMITGLYPYVRDGVVKAPEVTLSEIPQSLRVNPMYPKKLYIFAGDKQSAHWLEKFNLPVYRVFDDAPASVRHNAAHLMKHWMCLWALKKFGEFLWVDWDTVMLRPPDKTLANFCRQGQTPKFIRIPNYWATVNCGVYYAGYEWLAAMERSFAAKVDEPNDELLWASVLPADVREQKQFWWGDYAVNIWTEADINVITGNTYFAHVKNLAWAEKLRRHQAQVGTR